MPRAQYPRLKDRGPIEAISTGQLEDSGFVYPRLKDRGPIEAGSHTPWLLWQGQGYPRLKDRGPIEASLLSDTALLWPFVSAVEGPRPN